MKKALLSVICIWLIVLLTVACAAEIPKNLIDSLSPSDKTKLISYIDAVIVKKQIGLQSPSVFTALDMDLMELSVEELRNMQEYLKNGSLPPNDIGAGQEDNGQNTEDDIPSDNFDYSLFADFFSRQEEYENALCQSAEERISEYWNVELIGIDLYLDDAYIFGESKKEHISVINVKLRWNAENSTEKTRNMLSMYSDDMAVTLHNVYPDIPIDQMRIVWEVPYILKDGYVAKYQYYSIGENMYCSDRYGVLYGRM